MRLYTASSSVTSKPALWSLSTRLTSWVACCGGRAWWWYWGGKLLPEWPYMLCEWLPWEWCCCAEDYVCWPIIWLRFIRFCSSGIPDKSYYIPFKLTPAWGMAEYACCIGFDDACWRLLFYYYWSWLLILGKRWDFYFQMNCTYRDKNYNEISRKYFKFNN